MEDDIRVSKQNRRRRRDADRRRMPVDGASVKLFPRLAQERAEGKRPLYGPKKPKQKKGRKGGGR